MEAWEEEEEEEGQGGLALLGSGFNTASPLQQVTSQNLPRVTPLAAQPLHPTWPPGGMAAPVEGVQPGGGSGGRTGGSSESQDEFVDSEDKTLNSVRRGTRGNNFGGLFQAPAVMLPNSETFLLYLNLTNQNLIPNLDWNRKPDLEPKPEPVFIRM